MPYQILIEKGKKKKMTPQLKIGHVYPKIKRITNDAQF